jgi:hypothetical protein
MSPRCVSNCIWTCWYECFNVGFSSCWNLNRRLNNDALGFDFRMIENRLCCKTCALQT